MPPTFPRSSALLACAATLFLSIAACSTGGAGDPAPAAATGTGGRGGGQTPTVPVSTANVTKQSVPLSIDVIGTVEAYSNVAVHAQITGELTSVGFKEGEDVTQGQVLFTLDRRPLESALQQAQANLARDTAQAANAKASAARYQDLLQKGIATKEQTDTASTSADALQATVNADKAAIDNATVQLQYATIKAPIPGRTGALMVHAGNLVRANDTTPMVIINQVAPIYVSFGIPEGQLPDLKKYIAAGTVHLRASATNETVASEGRITFIDNNVDATTGQIKIKGEFPNEDHRLWPGGFANVAVTLKNDPNAVVVPTTAVQSGQQGNYVFVVKADKTVELRTITLERQTADNTVVKDGLMPGETVVIDGQLRLVPGSRVSIKSGPGGTKTKVEP
jgi:multidrug efflux system membrane fusion protein